MSVLSQSRLAERTKEVRRESWLTGNISRRGYQQDSTGLLNDNSDSRHRSGQLKSPNTDNTNSLSTLTDDIMEGPGNRRHGLIFQRSPSISTSRAHTRTLSAKDDYSALENLSDPKSRFLDSTESLAIDLRTSNLDSLSYTSSNSMIPSPRSSQSLRSHSTKRIIIPSTSRSLSDSFRSLSINLSPSQSAILDTEKIKNLVKTSSGNMRGQVEYQVNCGVIYCGSCYIDDVNGSLKYEGNGRAPYPLTVVADIRGLEVKTIRAEEGGLRSLELLNRELGEHIHFRPIFEEDFDYWLAALLIWQDTRPDNLSVKPSWPSSNGSDSRKDSRKPIQNKDKPTPVKSSSIIKVARLFLWDSTTSATQSMQKTSSKQSSLLPRTTWRCVSCILQDNGQFRLFAENDSNSSITLQLSQLSRCSVQQLDRSVLGKEFCIAIFPLYAITSSQLSFFNPVYIASESRLMHEVWFCLLRAFTVPEIYGQCFNNSIDESNNPSLLPQSFIADDGFRIEKSIKMRIVEAKFSKKISVKAKIPHVGKPKKDEIDTSVGDYFVEVVLDGEIRARTSIRNETKNPFWREDCEFQNLPPNPPSLMIVLKKIVTTAAYSNSPQSNSKTNILVETMSWTTEVPVSKIERGEDNEAWWPILDQRQEIAGEILLSIRYDELVVLLASQYQTLSELLHNFSSGLTIQISQFIPARLKLVSDLMLNIFQVSGYAEDWLTTLVEDEIDGLEKETPTDCQTRWIKKPVQDELTQPGINDREQSVRDMSKTLQEEANLLFRGNSLLTQALDFHMRRIGKEYLEDLLLDKIAEINILNPDCEVDPSRILNNNDINKNWTLLFSLTTDTWECIASSAESCPSELRQILKYIRAVAEDRYGNFLRTVVYTSVSGFLFLRFFCPAIMNPKVFGLLKDNPQPKAQRTLTLIAKSLQALANLSNFGKKEAWMEPMNRFLTSHRQSMKKFIDSICAVSVGQNTSNLPASYSTPITIFGRLPRISREGFPSLPYLIDHALNFSKLVKLWVETTAKNPKLESLQGELLQFHQLCLKIQHRADECLHRAEQYKQNTYKQPQNILESPKNTLGHDIVNDMELSNHCQAGGLASTALKSTGYASTSTKANPVYRKRSLKSNNGTKEQLLLSNLKPLKEQDRMDIGTTSSLRGQNREEWPLRSFLGGLKRRGKENGGSLNRDSDMIISTSLSDEFV